MPLGRNLKFLREARGLSHDRLGALAGPKDEPISGQAISNLESRGSERSKFAPALAKALEVPLTDLLQLDLQSKEDAFRYLAERERQALQAPAAPNAPSIKWLASYLKLDQDQRAAVDKYVAVAIDAARQEQSDASDKTKGQRRKQPVRAGGQKVVWLDDYRSRAPVS